MRRSLRTVAVEVLGIALSALCVSQAGATTFTNGIPNASNSYGPFGSGGTTAMGEVFIAPGGVLQDWTFFYAFNLYENNPSTPTFLELVVAKWNPGSGPGQGFAVGPALYTSQPTYIPYSASACCGTIPLTFSDIDLALTQNNPYVVYITVAGVLDPVYDLGLA